MKTRLLSNVVRRPRNLPRAYQIGLLVAVAVSIGIFLTILHQASIIRQDNKTDQAFSIIDDKVYNYGSTKKQVPTSLASIGIHAPPSITYKKVSNDTYKLCATFKSSFIASYRDSPRCETSKIYFPASQTSQTSQNPQTTQVQSSPPPFTKNADGSYTVCGVHTNYFDGEGHVLQGPPATPGSISISSDSYPYVGSRLLFMITAGSREFDEKCNPITATDMTVGSTVAAFDITSPNTSATTIFLKRSF